MENSWLSATSVVPSGPTTFLYTVMVAGFCLLTIVMVAVPPDATVAGLEFE